HAWFREGGMAGAETQTLDLQLLDGEGRVLGELVGLVVKRAQREALLRSLRPEMANLLYRLEWRELPAQEPERAADTKPGTWLVLTDTGGFGAALTAALAARGQRCVPVEAGTSFEERAEGSFTVQPGEAAQFDQLLTAALPAEAPPLAGIAYLWGLEN